MQFQFTILYIHQGISKAEHPGHISFNILWTPSRLAWFPLPQSSAVL
jgi:hypothetical protein